MKGDVKRRYRGTCYLCGKRRMLRYPPPVSDEVLRKYGIKAEDMSYSAECQWCLAKFTRTARAIQRVRDRLALREPL